MRNPRAPATPSTKYYVVGPPASGHREYLFGIAAETLGNGNRYGEIFDLNKDVRSPADVG